MGRVSTCQKNCNTIDLRGAQVNHSLYVFSQWETALQCNTISHWLGAYTEWSLPLGFIMTDSTALSTTRLLYCHNSLPAHQSNSLHHLHDPCEVSECKRVNLCHYLIWQLLPSIIINLAIKHQRQFVQLQTSKECHDCMEYQYPYYKCH